MTDLELLDIHNHIARKMIESSENYEHIAFEIPEGKPQIRFEQNSYQWVANGDVIRCCVGWNEKNDGPAIEIDDKTLTWQEFGRMISTWEGWGMRIICVPDDQLTTIPTVVIGEREFMNSNPLEQTPGAKKFWESIPSNIRIKLLNNVYCAHCSETRSVANAKMNIEKGDLIIRGICTTCSGEVCRLVEGD